MKKYPKYKDSGVEWIGEIPKDWSFTKLKFITGLFGRIGYRGYTVQDIVEKGKGAISLSPSNIIDQKLDLEKGTYISWEKHEESPEIKIYNDDIILVKTASVGKVCYISGLIEEATINPQLVVFKDVVIDKKYLYYLLISDVLQEQIKSDLVGGVVPTISQSVINNYYIPFQTKEEQTQIAKYLDYKTNQIETLIANKQKLIELLHEERTAIINHAVTKGINAKAKLKPSGVEWLGDVPENWEVKKLKHVVECNREALGEKTESDKSINYIEIGDVNSETGINNFTNYLFKDAPSRARRIVRSGDILISTVRTYLKAISRVSNEFDNYVASTGFAVLTPIKIDSEFLGYIALTDGFIGEIISKSRGVSYPSITAEELIGINIPLPKIEEQISIAKVIKIESNRINTIINKTEQEIELMKEYKIALISEVVTGKVDVRNEVIR